MTHRSAVAVLAVLLLATGWAVPGRADEAGARREDQLKAAYLFNFVKFVEWPEGAVGQTLIVCFLGGAGVHAALAAGIENKKAGQRSLLARKVARSDGAGDCNVLYIEAGAAPVDWQALLAGTRAVLTVSDAGKFTHNGGMIELFTESNRLRFNIQLGHAHKAGLRVSSSLLQLAAAVEKEGAK
jgi:hypothetical protein